MPGDYTDAEIAAMSTTELVEARVNEWRKPQTTRLRPEEVRLIASPGADAPVQVESYAVPQSAPGGRDVWKRKKSGDEDFTCPSGQTCRLRPLQLEKLMMEGILDQVTRLEGLAQALINQAEGLPPEKQHMPTREEFAQLLDAINSIVPMAVAEPRVYADDDKDAPDDALRVSDIELMDRVAIMEKALGGLKKMDNFRNAR
jgi:hypothetical protein